MPFFAPSVSTESDAAFSFLAQQCTQLTYTAHGLTEEQALSRPTASGLSISGLLVHVAQVVNGWLRQVREPAKLIGIEDYQAINEQIGLVGEFDGSQSPELGLSEVLAVCDRVLDEVEAVRAIVESGEVSLDDRIEKMGNPWIPSDFVMNVRWILAHLNTEVARHVGHADIIRESIDGKQAYELNARAEGQPWPPEDWG